MPAQWRAYLTRKTPLYRTCDKIHRYGYNGCCAKAALTRLALPYLCDRRGRVYVVVHYTTFLKFRKFVQIVFFKLGQILRKLGALPFVCQVQEIAVGPCYRFQLLLS